MAGATVALTKAVGVACGLAAGLLTRRAALAWGAPPRLALWAALALVWMGPVVWGALSGMEVTLGAALVAGALAAHAAGRDLATAALASLAVAARPEAAVLLPFLALAGPLRPARLGAFLVAPLAVAAPMVAFAYATVGAPYPATAAAKVRGGLLGWLAGVQEPLAATLIARPLSFSIDWIRWLWDTHALLPLALAPALVLVWWRGGRRLGLVSLVLLAHPLAMALLAPYRGPSFQSGRYSIHLLPVALVAVAAGVGAGLGRWRRTLTLGWLALALLALIPAAERYAWGVQNIEAMQVSLGHWLDTHTPRTARLAVNDIGAIAFVSRREIVDLMGLVTPEILPYRRQGEEGVIRFVQERCPDYVVVFPTWFPRLTARTDMLEPLHSVRLAHVQVSGGREMVVYRVLRCAL